ncbi:MAG: multicopper oxidase domain-containing protein, partial [Acidimicrobiia bacterium]|nr:multicopper oxidase domain-containing protein [Acidimicrobiia bacterium]
MFTKESSSMRVGTTKRLVVLATVLAMTFIGNVAPAAAAPRVGTVAVAAQVGTLTAGTAGSVTYVVTVTNGDGKNVTAGLSVTGGLPTGATYSFNPTSLAFVTAPPGTPLTSTLTITTNATTPAGATPFTVQAVRTNGGNGSDLATGPGTLTIGAAPGLTPQTITFDPLADKTFTNPAVPFTVSATASSGLLVTFAATGDCTIAVDSVTITGAGSCTITASQAGNAIYDPAPDVPQTFAIAKAAQTITFDPLADKTVGDGFTATAIGDAATSNPVNFTASGPCAVTTAGVGSTTGSGSCTIFASQAGDANYLDAVAAQTFVILPAAGADATFDLYAVTGTASLPGAPSVNGYWGYNTTDTAVTQPGGPTLTVDQGDVVVVTLHNTLSEASSLLFGGQSMIPDTAGAPADGTRSYIFTADNPGTYLYEAGLVPNAQHQVAMGLYGALIVRPAAAVPLPPLTTPLTVVNAGFEDNVLDDGAFTSSFAAGWTVLS